MSTFWTKFMGFYRNVIFAFLGISDEKFSFIAQQNLAAGKELDIIDLDGVIGVKPETSAKQYFEANCLPILLKETLKSTPSALYHSLLHPYKLDYQDSDIAYLCNQTYYSRLITISSDGRPVIDLMHYGDLITLTGFYTHNIQAFLQKNNNQFELDSICIDGTTITSSHQNWSLAKIHFLAALDNETLFADHAVIHISNNIFEATVKKFLSADNPLRLFLTQHFGFSIHLDELIMDLLHKHSSPANPIGFTIQSVYQIINKGFEKYFANGLNPSFASTFYSSIMQESQDIICDYVEDFINHNLNINSTAFVEIRTLSDELRKVIPFYPRGEELTPQLLKNMVARFIYEGSFQSSTDHIITYKKLGYFKTIFRIRKPFSENASFKINDLFHPIDTYQRVIFRRIFSGNKCIRPLFKIEHNPAIHLNMAKFKARLYNLESKYPDIFPMESISAFIDI